MSFVRYTHATQVDKFILLSVVQLAINFGTKRNIYATSVHPAITGLEYHS